MKMPRVGIIGIGQSAFKSRRDDASEQRDRDRHDAP